MTSDNFLHPKYRPDIDGLRALAILPVVIFHAFPGFIKGGFVGVDIFFVISGYLISTIILHNLDKDSFSFFEFYLRRIKRIFPALIIVLFACMIFGWFALLPDEYMQLGKHIVGGASFTSNFLLWSESGYFDNAAEIKPLLHLWSLGIEEQFYIIWPLLLWVAYKSKLNLIGFTLTIAVISFYFNIRQANINLVADFFSPQTRFWELMLGSIIARLSPPNTWSFDNHDNFVCIKNLIRIKFKLHAVLSFTSILGLVLIFFSFFKINKVIGFPGVWALLPSLGTSLIIISGPQAWVNRTILSNNVAIWIGLISFPLYLWHWPLLSFARIVGHQNPSRYIRFELILVAIFLSWVTFLYIEKKIRKSKSILIAGMLLMSIFAVGMLGYVIDKSGGVPNRKAVVASGFNEKISNQFMGSLWKYAKNDICLNEYPYSESKTFGWWFCIKSSSSPPTILLLGNSYANQLYPGLVNNIRLSAHSILSIGTCDFGSDGEDVTDTYSPCYRNRAISQQKFIDNLIAEGSKSIKFVIIDGLQRNPTYDYIARVKKRVDFLEGLGLQVIIFTPHLKPEFSPKLCFKTPFRSAPHDCSFSSLRRKILFENFQPLMKSIAKSNPKVLFFEQNELFCDEDKNSCSWIKNGMPLHRDESHTSEYESILLQKYFNRWLESNLPEIFYL